MDKNFKIKVSDISGKKDSVSKFSIQYSSKNAENSKISYQIMSALKTNERIIMEVSSSIMKLSQSENKKLFSRIMEDLDKWGIQYKKKKISVYNKISIMSISLKSEAIEGYELLAAIPDEVWRNEEFRRILPNTGVRYYLSERGEEIDLETFMDLDEEEQIKLCSMVIFDYILLGSMGINTCIKKKADIIELLNRD
ncbi:hypothetical protein LY28_01167 [Ruminiclostridium sufflavum DSM 19573]|uniref:Uncharacterized protein n=1 Tax=Ruminiclostridium sufflavum DSM 19573 TaxID=1121337 RepID=A0A318XM46_9FIRM|nr:hypothetical protein [Ruminiclostridium sufflavum]PYG88807.1 hypothetical protein LY28_01167 [Ruminiclostridium sufflavum DSM 19573]